MSEKKKQKRIQRRKLVKMIQSLKPKDRKKMMEACRPVQVKAENGNKKTTKSLGKKAWILENSLKKVE